MSNAAKHRKKAAEFEQLKQIDRAIVMYIKAIESSESEGEEVDVALLNKVGDLTLRQGRVSDAVTYYERAVEHYASVGLFNNAIALCNKILRSAPGRANVYFTLGRICAKKGLRGDATRNFLEYATRMQQEGRVDEGMRALSEVADLMPELTEVRRLVEEHATRAGIALPRRKTPAAAQTALVDGAQPRPSAKSNELVFLDLGPASETSRNTPPLAPRVVMPPSSTAAPDNRRTGADRRAGSGPRASGVADRRDAGRAGSPSGGSKSLDEFLLFDPTRPGAVTPLGARAVGLSTQSAGAAQQPLPAPTDPAVANEIPAATPAADAPVAAEAAGAAAGGSRSSRSRSRSPSSQNRSPSPSKRHRRKAAHPSPSNRSRATPTPRSPHRRRRRRRSHGRMNLV
jgi:hypothetical protein